MHSNMATLIVTGGRVDIEFLRRTIEQNDFDRIIAVDSGVEALDALEMLPDVILGDFDSAKKSIIDKYRFLGAQLLQYPSNKDKTDTHLAIEEALKVEKDEITILGAIGTRLDHTLANLQVLKVALDPHVSCSIVNENNKIFLTSKTAQFNKENYEFISLIPMTNVVKGVTTEGLKYELISYDLVQGLSIGVSNEFIADNGRVTIDDGILIIILSKD